MIHHLTMNVTRNLDLFPSKGGVLDKYSSYMIMSQRNWNYNKKQVEFGAYVQASQVNDPKNTNSMSKI